MTVLALGVNHGSAPLAFRERVAFAPEQLPVALQALRAVPGVHEAAILSTCNRTDVYCGVQPGARAQAVRAWLSRFHGVAEDELRHHSYEHAAEQAVRHVMRVASGLDSMVLGEPQILGQLKGAWRSGRDARSVGLVLDRLFQQTFSVAKRVRTDTAIGASSVSVASAAVSLARRVFGDLSERGALLIGAGETIELAARHLHAQGLRRMTVANRTVERAHRLAAQFGGSAIGLDAIEAHLPQADIVISSTGSPEALVGVEAVRRALRARRRRPILFVDIAVPHDVDPAVGALEDVFLYTVDDLHDVVEENRRSRREAAGTAEQIIDTHVGQFMGWLGTRAVAGTICGLREEADVHRERVLARARRMLAAGRPPEDALEYVARALTNRLTHAPTVAVRRAGAQRRDDLVEAARELFDLDRTRRG